ncbi:MAG: ABC-2 family transporter protein [Planctomycetota bacterium]|nr:ABC-2 family transporter protein [Planctomycetota bacterium]MDG1984660.1 ABC-2 family transporter protein [Planctomycetota bacterium]
MSGSEQEGAAGGRHVPWRRAASALRWGLAVERQYIRIGFVRKSQFRVEFVNQVLMDLCFYAAFILTFEILYGLGGEGTLTLGGWSHEEMRVYMGMVFVADGLFMTFLGQQWHFGQDLKDGNLDAFRVRPGSPAFLYFFQRFSPEGMTNLAFGLGWLIFALAGVMPELVDPADLAWALPAAVAVIAWSQVFLMLAYNVTEFWLLNSDVGHLVSMLVSNFGERPLEVYPGALARVLKFVVPVAGMAWYPASLVLGRLELGFALGYPLVLAAFALVVLGLFRRGMRRYESAMG